MEAPAAPAPSPMPGGSAVTLSGAGQTVALVLALVAVVLFGVAAVAYSWLRQRKQGPDSPEFFLTARRSVGAFTIAWAFYAGAMGSWALFGPPSYCLSAGILGLIMYSFSCGLPVFIIGALGGIVHDLVPNVLSFTDFVNRRFGLVVSLYVFCIMLFNMGIAITAEFTAVGDLFEYVIGISRIPVVVTIGAVSILYTALGGLYISIITDQWQAVCNVAFLLILVIYVAVTFREPLPPLPNSLTWGTPPYWPPWGGAVDLSWSNYFGFAAIAVMPISLTTSTLFSEAMWQRCWATTDRKSLLLGSFLGGCLVIAAVFLLGFGGLLAVWSGLWVPADENDPGNTTLFALFNNQTWVVIIATLLAVVMSESAVDSLQNAIADLMASTLATVARAISKAFPETEQHLAFIENLNLWWIRALVLVLNVVPIIISLQGYNVLQLFLMANLITACTAVPVLSGIAQGGLSRIVVTPFSVMFGCLNGLASLFWWTAIYANMNEMTYLDALTTTFLFSYDWPPFVIGLGASVVGMLVGAALEFGFRRVTKKEYPQYDLSEPIKGQMRDATTAMMAQAFSENSGRDDSPVKGANGQQYGVDVNDATASDPMVGWEGFGRGEPPKQ